VYTYTYRDIRIRICVYTYTYNGYAYIHIHITDIFMRMARTHKKHVENTGLATGVVCPLFIKEHIRNT
jgi:hypothetical protein